MNAAPLALRASSVKTLGYYHGSSSSLTAPKTKAPRRDFCSHGPVGRLPFETSAKVNRPQAGGYNTLQNKSAPPRRGALN